MHWLPIPDEVPGNQAKLKDHWVQLLAIIANDMNSGLGTTQSICKTPYTLAKLENYSIVIEHTN